MDTVLKLFLIVLVCLKISSAIENKRYYPRYHLAPVKGWMNDPNGFCVYKGEYHLFYQYNPESSREPGTARWGHAKSKDLFHWKDLGTAMNHDKTYDKNGVFSGSAVVDSNVMYLFYTGHVKHPNRRPNQTETQELAISKDGIHFTKYENNPIILGKDLQPNIRDPKVWKHGNSWYMVLGNSFVSKNGRNLGRVLLFKSSDKVNWKQVSILGESDGFLGYMWECPDFFEIDGRFVLLFSPQGVKREGDKYKNRYQTGYIVGHFSYTNHVFTPITNFRVLDNGHDFYATQSILDNYKRRLVVAWMDMWIDSYPTSSPEAKDGFTGQLTMVRTLHLTNDNHLLQKPVKEIASVRGRTLFMGKSFAGVTVSLPNKAGEVFIIAPDSKDFILYIGSKTSSVQIKYEYRKGRVSLKRNESDDGLRRTEYRPLSKLIIRVFIDASSIEVFFGEGEVTFSSRFFVDAAINVRLGDNSTAEMLTVYELKTTLYN